MIRRVTPLLLAGLLLATHGCSYALRKSNTPSQEKLQIQAVAATSYTVLIVGAEKTETFTPAVDGRVTLNVPPLPRGCDVHLFGIIKVEDGGPEHIPAIHVLRGEKVARKLSLASLRRLPVDAEGYYVLILEDENA